MRMPAKMGLKRDRLRLQFQRRCGAQLQHGVIPSLRANLPFSLVEASSDKSSQSLSSAFARPIRPRNDGPEIHFGQVSNSTSSHSRGACVRALHDVVPRKKRGSRECRVHAAPAVSCAKLRKELRTRAYRFSGGSPAFPAQWSYGLCRALPGDEFVLSPSPANKRLAVMGIASAFARGATADKSLHPSYGTIRRNAARPGTTNQPPLV
jgi:hypothetical protein